LKSIEELTALSFDFFPLLWICWRATADEDGHYCFAVAL
jgi:hypothetical protein